MTKHALNPSDPASILPSLPRGAEALILRLRSLGDVVMLTPALEALHAWRPDLRLSVMVQPALAPVLEGNTAVAEILPFTRFVAASRDLRRRRFPVVFNQHGGPTSAFLALSSGAAVRVGWAGTQFALFYNVLVPGPEAFYGRARVHTVAHRLTQFYWTGLPRVPIPPARVFPQFDAVESVRARLTEHGVAPGARYAVVHPGAAFFTRRWPIERFSDLIDWLRLRHGIVSVIAPGPGDESIAAAVRARLAPRAVVLDAVRVRELIALLAGAALYVGNDTGPTHLAVAAGRPVVMIFGSTNSEIWGPWQVPHRAVRNDYPCNPCPGDRCYAFDVPHCILSVTIEQVREACEALLAGHAAGATAAAPVRIADSS